MLAVINDTIYNLDKYDVFKKGGERTILGFINCNVNLTISFDTYDERDAEWNKLVSNIKEWYT